MLLSRLARPLGSEKKDWGNLGWKDVEKMFEREGKAAGGGGGAGAVNESDWRGSRTGLCSVPYHTICHLWRIPRPARGGRSGPAFSTSSVHWPRIDSAQKWTERKGQSSNLVPSVSRGRGKRRVERVPAGEVSTNMMFPRGM